MGLGIGGGGNSKKTTKNTDNTRNYNVQPVAHGNANTQTTTSYTDLGAGGGDVSIQAVDFGAVDKAMNLASMSLESAAMLNMKALEQNERALTSNFDQTAAMQKASLDIAGQASGASLTEKALIAVAVLAGLWALRR